MISVEDALGRIFALLEPLGAETVALADAAGRVLAAPVPARRAQPPFAASAMDGYAVKNVEAEPGAMFRVVGTSAAGHGYAGGVGPGQSVRIFTGAPVPEGADRVVIQEDVERRGEVITLKPGLGTGLHIRPKGADFRPGDRVEPGRVLGPSEMTLIAAMNVAEVAVTRRPEVAIMATGDELVMPGEDPGPDQIIASNGFGLKAMIESHGGKARMLPVARDNEDSLTAAFSLAEGTDLIVTIGGASVGDHDLVGQVAAGLGMEQSFYKVAMRPGKPLMAGRLMGTALIGLPGNPVSTLVCGQVFLIPALRALLGLGAAPAPRRNARLATPLGANGEREHYMRAAVAGDGIRAFERQDSALTSVMARANALLIRPVGDGPRTAGEIVDYLPL